MHIDSEKLKEYRNQKGWSQDLLAKASGLSLRTVQRIEKNNSASPESILAICAALDITSSVLTPQQKHISANWNRRNIMQGLFAISVFIITLGTLFYLAAPLLVFVSGTLITYTIAFLMSATIIAFGVDGLMSSLKGWRYLFTQEIKGGEAAVYLAKIYQFQIHFTYGAAVLAFAIGVASIHGNEPLFSDPVRVNEGYSVLSLAIVYAAILSEVILRPLKAKLETCDIGSDL